MGGHPPGTAKLRAFPVCKVARSVSDPGSLRERIVISEFQTMQAKG
jgi:hypothetical protein